MIIIGRKTNGLTGIVLRFVYKNFGSIYYIVFFSVEHLTFLKDLFVLRVIVPEQVCVIINTSL